jgi:hypothetical protein
MLLLAVCVFAGCQKRLPDTATIETFVYETRGTAMGSETSFSIAREGDGFIVTQSAGGGQIVHTAYVGRETVAQATDILRAHNVLSWNEYAESNPLVLDGTSFSLFIVFDDGTTISARGTNSYPKGLSAAVREIQSLFDRFLSEPDQ